MQTTKKQNNNWLEFFYTLLILIALLGVDRLALWDKYLEYIGLSQLNMLLHDSDVL